MTEIILGTLSLSIFTLLLWAHYYRWRCKKQTDKCYWPESLGYNVPQNLDKAIEYLNHIMSKDMKILIRDSPNDVPYYYHHDTIGRTLRNEWGLWNKHNSFHKYFKEMGLFHPDDMSSAILGTYRAYLHSTKYDIDKHIKISQHYWERKGLDHEGNAI